MKRASMVILSFWVLLAAVGCSSFRRDARAAMAPGAEAKGIEGYWQGRWYDLKDTDHGGKLELVLVRTGDHTYRASTRSHWWKLFRSSYDTTLVLTPTAPGAYLLQGDEYLWLWGGFTVTGRVDATHFDAVYRSLGHRGAMELRRGEAAVPASAKP